MRPSRARSASAARDSSSVKGAVFMSFSHDVDRFVRYVFAGGAENEGVGSRRDERKTNRRVPVAVAVALLGLKPDAKARIVNLGLVVPEIGVEAARDAQMVELEFNLSYAFWKIAPNIAGADIEARYAMARGL